MRTFKVWLVTPRNGSKNYETVEMPDDASDDECEAECKECLEAMIGSVLDSGWEEI